MITSTRGHLLGYVLGALEANEQAQVEQDLLTNPQLRDELEILRRRVEPLQWLDEPPGPSPGLAARTLDSILPSGVAADRRFRFPETDRHEPVRSAAHSASDSASEDEEVPAGRLDGRLRLAGSSSNSGNRCTVSDMFVGGGLCLALLVMLAPALQSNREMARRALCQNNLRLLGESLGTFASFSPQGAFPSIPIAGKTAFAGILAPKLADRELLPDPEVLMCPSDELQLLVCSLADLDSAAPEELAEARRRLLGSMGYNLGVIVDGKYESPRALGRSYYAIMSEMPRSSRAGNHGHGRNVLFEDQHVQYVMACRTGDDPFHNRHGLVAAGIGPNDAVIGASHVSPLAPEMVKTIDWAP